MITNNTVDIGLTGLTGSGNFVGSMMPTIISPILTGQATFSSLTFNPTSGGIIGTNTNDNVMTSYVGEFLTMNVPASAPILLMVDMPINLASLVLTAGDWEVWGNIGGNLLENRPVQGRIQQFQGAISPNSVTMPTDDSNIALYTFYDITLHEYKSFNVPTLRFSLPNVTTIYLVSLLTATGPGVSVSMNIYGNLSARRIR